MIEFNEERHEYRVNGVIIPSVTQVLSSVGLPDLSGIPADLLEWKAGLGTAVHRAIELDCYDDLEESSLHPDVKPYFAGYLQFKKDSGFVPGVAECRIYHSKYNYAGTADTIGTMGTKADLTLVDYKSGLVDKLCVGPQTAAYVEGWMDAGEFALIKRRYALKLNKDATYRLIRLDNKMDFQIFLNALNIYKWRNQ